MSAIALGDRLGDNRLDAVAGQGAIGVVYRATQVGLERTVAVKVVGPPLAADPDFRERFAREVRALAGVEHPNLIPIHQVGERGGRPFVSMRWVDGHDLGHELRAGAGLDPERVLDVVDQVAGALDAAHACDLVHGDVKPSNILLEQRPDGEHAYLSDFGAGGGEPGGAAGQYAAPELLAGAAPDPRSDVYALACVLFEALARTGQHAAGAAALGAVRATALAEDPAQRYPSAAALVAAARGELRRARAAHAAAAAAARAADGSAAAAQAGGAGRRGRLRRLAPALLAVAVTVAAAAVVAVVLVAGSASSRSGRHAGTPSTGAGPAGTVTRIALGATGVGPVAAGAGRVYVGDTPGRALFVIDAAAGRKLARVKLPGEPQQVIVDARRRMVWVGLVDHRLVGISTRTNRIRGRPLKLPLEPDDLFFLGGRLVAAQHDTVRMARIDLRRRRIVGKIVTYASSSLGIVRVGSSVLGVFGLSPGIVTWNARLHVTGEHSIDAYLPNDIAFADGTLFVTDFGQAGVHRLDPASDKRSAPAITVGRNPFALTYDGTSLWVVNKGDNSVTRVDPRKGRAIGLPVDVGPLGGDVAPRAGGGAWVPRRTDLVEIKPTGGL